MTASQKATKKANEVLEAARTEYEKIKDEIGKYEIQKNTAAADMETAGANCDLAKYNTARTAKNDAETALEMFNHKRERLEAEPLLDAAEYQTLCAGIIAEVEDYITDLKEELYQTTAALEAKHDEAAAKINDANKLLHTLQYDCYRGHDLTFNTGSKIPNTSSVMEIRNRAFWDIVAWAGRLDDGNIYKTMKKEREEAKEAAANE